MRHFAAIALWLTLVVISTAQSPAFFRSYQTIDAADIDMRRIVSSGAGMSYSVGVLDKQTVVVHQIDRFGNVVAERQFPATVVVPDAINDVECAISTNAAGRVAIAYTPQCNNSAIPPRVIVMDPGLTTVFDVFANSGAVTIPSLLLEPAGSVLMGTVNGSTVTVKRLSAAGDQIFSTNFPGTNVRFFTIGTDGMVILQNGVDIETRRAVLSNGTYFNGTTIPNRTMVDAMQLTPSRYVVLMRNGANGELQSDTALNSSPSSIAIGGIPTSMAVSNEVYVSTSTSIHRVLLSLASFTSVANPNGIDRVFVQGDQGFTLSGAADSRVGRYLTPTPLSIGSTPYNLFKTSDLTFDPVDLFLMVGTNKSTSGATVDTARYRWQDGSGNDQELEMSIDAPVQSSPFAAVTTPEGDVVFATDRTRVVRVSRAGTTLWTTDLFTRTPTGPSILNIVRLSDGSFMVHMSVATGSASHRLFRLNGATGQILYQVQQFGGTGSIVKQVLADLVGDYYVLSSEIGRFDTSDMVIRRYRGSDGALLWKRTYDGNGLGSADDAFQMVRLANGNIVAFSSLNTGWFFVQITPGGVLINSSGFSNSVIKALGLASDGNITVLSNSGGTGRMLRFNPSGSGTTVDCPLALTAKAVFHTANSKPIAVADTTISQLDTVTGAAAWQFTTGAPQFFLKQIFFDSVGAIYVAKSKVLNGVGSSGMQVHRLNSLGTSVRSTTFDVNAPLFHPVGVKFLQGKELDLWLTGNVYETNKGRVVCLAKFGTPLAPVVRTDTYTTARNTQLVVPAPGVLLNDTDPNGNTMTVVVVNNPPPQQGSVTLNPNGSFTFTPANNFTGATKFTYRATDSTGLNSIPATANITVTP